MNIPASVTNIGHGAFRGCYSLTYIGVDSNNENYCSVDGVVFSKDMKNIVQFPCGYSGHYVIPENVTTIVSSAFYDCKSLTTVTIPNSVTSIGDHAFFGDEMLTSVNIPNTITSIEPAVFEGCHRLNNVTIPSSVKTIGLRAFRWCIGLSEISLPNSVTNIAEQAFFNCQSLRSITVPGSVTTIGPDIFRDCSNLADIFYEGTLEEWKAISGHENAQSNQWDVHCSDTNIRGIVLNSTTTFIHFGSTKQLTTILPSGGVDNRSVTWSSSDENVATVSETGLVTAVSEGTATITCTATDDSDISATCKVTVSSFYCYEDQETNANGKSQITYDDGAKLILIGNKEKSYARKYNNLEINGIDCSFIKGSNGAQNLFIAPEGKYVTHVDIYAFINNYLGERITYWNEVNGVLYSLTGEDGTAVTQSIIDPEAAYTKQSFDFDGVDSFTFTNYGYQVCFVLNIKYGEQGTSVKLDKNKLKIENSDPVQLTATVSTTSEDKSVTWSSSNTDVAIVDQNGLVTPSKLNGTTIITATANDGSGVNASCTVIVTGIKTEETEDIPTSIALNRNEAVISVGETLLLTATTSPSETTRDIIWSSNNTGIATVSTDGVVKGVSNGTAVITATVDGTSVYVDCTITVNEVPTDPDIEESTDVSQYPIALYINDVESRAGDLNLELNMKCEEENITAYQCDVYLPEGVTWKYTTDKRGKVIYDLPTFNEDRTDNSYHTITPIAKMADGSYSIIVYSMDKEYILDTDGVLMYLPLEISDEMEAGDYNIIMKNIVLTNVDKNQTLISKMVSKLTIPSYKVGDVNGDDLINVTDIVGVIDLMRGEGEGSIREAADVNGDGLINVTDIVGLIDLMRGEANEAKAAFMTEVPSFATMAKGVMAANEDCDKCNLEVIPFTVANGTTASTVKLNLNNPGDEFTAFQCDVYFPEGISWATTVDKRGNVKVTQPVFDAEADRTDATYHTVNAGLNSNGSFNVVVYSMDKEIILDEEGAVLDLPFAFDANLKPGVYDITLKNIVLTRQDKSDEKPADYTFSIMVGSPEDNAIALHGDFTADAIQEYNTVLAANSSVASVDFSEAKAVDGTKAITTGNENAVIYVAEGVSVKNTKNVVAGNKCQNLVLNDAYDFSAPKSFTAVNVNYEAAVSASLGYKTLVLPYNCAVPSGFEAYEVGSLSGNTLSLVQVESITANKPVILKNAGTASLSATNVTVNATAATLTNGKLVGTYTNIPAPVGSYVLQNQGGNVAFYQVVAGKQPVVGPFRAYLEASEAGTKGALMIGDGATALLDTKSGALIENIEGVFNADGVRKTNITDGVNIIRTADGEVKKVMK